MIRLGCVHLCDDLAMGGVTKGLSVYDHPDLAATVASRVELVRPGWSLAPRFAEAVIVTHFPPSWRTLPFLTSLRLRNRRARLVHVEHSYTGAWEALKVAHPRRFHAMLRIALRLFDEVVTVSHGQARWLAAAAGLPFGQVQVLHPWSGAQRLDAVPAPGPTAGRPLVLGAYGRFAEQKGFDVLVAAMRRLDPDRFTLRLGGFGEDEATLRAAAADLPHVRFDGTVTDVPGFIAGCDIIVVPSRWEAFGQVVAEAKLAARPVLVADVDGMPEQVGDFGVVTDCTSPEGIAAAVVNMATMPLPAMGQAARAAMAGVERQRIGAWRAMFDRARDQLGVARA